VHVLRKEWPLPQHLPGKQEKGQAAGQRGHHHHSVDLDSPGCSPCGGLQRFSPVLGDRRVKKLSCSVATCGQQPSARFRATSLVNPSHGPICLVNLFSVLTVEEPPRPSPTRSTSHVTSTASHAISAASHEVSAASLSPNLGSEAHIILGCLIDGQIEGTSMIDCGATSQFMDKDFALKHGLKLRERPIPETLTVIDGRTLVAEDLTHEVTGQLLIDQHLEYVVFQITKLGAVPLILGKTWLCRHNPLIDWVDNTVNLRSAWCQAHCLPHRSDALEPSRPTPASSSPVQISMVSATAYSPDFKVSGHLKIPVPCRVTLSDVRRLRGFPAGEDSISRKKSQLAQL
jgi:hypothetical protein